MLSIDATCKLSVDGLKWELVAPHTPIKSFMERDTDLIKTHDQKSFWHSSAHLLGWALELKYGSNCLLINGPATERGFFYDAFLFENSGRFLQTRKDMLDRLGLDELIKPERVENDIQNLLLGQHGDPLFPTRNDQDELSKTIIKLAARKNDFRCAKISRSAAQTIFYQSPFKLALINRIPENEKITLYKCGDFVDLCRGPHIPNSSFIASAIIENISGAQWNSKTPQNLSRFSGTSFESAADLKSYKLRKAEAERNNHRVIGKRQGLFTFHPSSPGSPFFLPHGTRIINALKAYLGREYIRFGFQEVITPLIFNRSLWVTSGHWENYRNDMFLIENAVVEDKDLLQENHESMGQGLKPMNCPGHCLLFQDTGKSYRDLPLRFAEFSPLHRNEASGALSGLTRVRKFHQDDGHIFCALEQIKSEIKSSLDFIDRVYQKLGFENYHLSLSTRPSKYIGNEDTWDRAEKDLCQALDLTGREWFTKPGDGAFYGPKIDVMIKDALGRSHQTATIQLDFQLPERFGLSFVDKNGEHARPVIIHRAILGSIERIMGILIENNGGKWPFWLSPRHARIVTVRTVLKPIAVQVLHEMNQLLRDCNVYIDLDESDNTLSKQVRIASQLKYNYILTVGDREAESKTVNVRTREGIDLGGMTYPDLAELLRSNFNTSEGPAISTENDL